MQQIADQLREQHGLHVRGTAGLTTQTLSAALAAGGRFVVYEYCISLLVATLRGRSAIWYCPAGKGRRWPGFRYSLVSLLVGWWGVPWGFLYTPWTVFTNLTGGRDVTDEVLALVGQSGQPIDAFGSASESAVQA